MIERERENELWRELARVVIAGQQRITEEWMKKVGLYEEYERMKQNEQPKSDIISETKIIL